MRYLRLWLCFFRNAWHREFLFHSNFFLQILAHLLWFLFSLVFFEVLYLYVPSLGGWSRNAVLCLLGINQIVILLYEAFLGPNLQRLPERIREGSLDHDLLKPVNPLFWMSFQRVNFRALLALPLPIVVVAYAYVTGGYGWPGASNFALAVFLIFWAVFIRYILGLAVAILSLWFVRVQALFALQEEFLQYSGYPQSIYTREAAFFFTFVIPILFLANFPSRALLQDSPSFSLLIFILGYGLLGIWMTHKVFVWALKHYTSAGG